MGVVRSVEGGGAICSQEGTAIFGKILLSPLKYLQSGMVISFFVKYKERLVESSYEIQLKQRIKHTFLKEICLHTSLSFLQLLNYLS